MVASTSCDHVSWATSVRGVIEIDFLDKFANMSFGNCKGSLSVERESPGSCEILSELFKDLRRLRRREVLLLMAWIREEELGVLELRDVKLAS